MVGILDRDYSSERALDGSPYGLRPPEPSLLPWSIGLLLLSVIAVAALAPLHWFPSSVQPLVARARGGTALAGAPAVQRLAPVANVRVAPPAMNLPQPPVTALAEPTARPLPVQREPTAQKATAENPFIKPGTIYRCKGYSGGLFWSSAHCAQHKAIIDRIASVPVGLPFQQQVDIAAGEARQFELQLEREQREGRRSVACASLQSERDQIWARSGSGAGYVPLDQLGRDQTRWRQIEGLLTANGCRR